MRKILLLPFLFSLLMGCGDGRTDQMRALLHEQDSLNRAYQPLSLDTIRQLTDYFDHHGTNYDRVHAHYLLGSVYRDMGEAPASLASFQHAAEVADTTAGGDSLYALLAKIHGQMGILFIRQYLPQQAEEAFWEASKNAKQANDILLALDYQRYIVSTFYQRQLFDSIDIFSEQIADELRTLGDTVRAARSLGVAISSNIERDSIEKARRYMDIYEREGDIFDEDNHIRPELAVYNYYRGLYYLKKGDYPLSERLFRQALAHPMDKEQVKGGYLGLRKLFTALGQRDSTLKYTILYADANDTCYARQAREETANMQALYKYERVSRLASQKTLQLERNKAYTVIIVSIFLMAILGVAVSFYLYRKKKKQQLMQAHFRYHLAKTRLETLEKEQKNEKEKESIHHLDNDEIVKNIRQLEVEIVQLKRRIKEYRSENGLIDIIKKMATIGIGLMPSDWKDIEDYFFKEDPSFLPNLTNRYSNLSLFEQQVCMLTRLGFQVGEIASLLEKHISIISRIRKDLMDKIFHQKGKTKSFDFKIRSL